MEYHAWQSQGWQSQGWQQNKSSWWNQGHTAEDSGDDQATTMALMTLLLHSGGRRSASAVGFLYDRSQSCPHRKAIRARGGVSGFVAAHPEIFALEKPEPGEKCPSIRLRTQEEQWAWASRMQNEQASSATTKPTLCKYFQMGRCTKGNECAFDHGQAAPIQNVQNTNKVFSCREAIVRKQVLFYLSEENLRTDTYFKNVIAESTDDWIPIDCILRCPRMQHMGVTTREVIDALRGATEVQLRDVPGKEALQRTRSQQQHDQVSPHSPEHKGRQPQLFTPEATLEEQPLKLLRDIGTGWESVIEDAPRRSWCGYRANTWPDTLLQAELQLLRYSVAWQELRTRDQSFVTRSTAWYVRGGCRCRYVYGEVSIEPQERPAWLDTIEARVLGGGCGLPREEWPDSVNLNFYQHDGQNVGWHSDDENLFRGSDSDCRIISASWGAPRTFDLALKDLAHPSGRASVYHNSVTSIQLAPGDLCSMEGLMQRHYSHQIVKGTTEESPPTNVRVNLTWRYIVQHKPYCPLAHKG